MLYPRHFISPRTFRHGSPQGTTVIAVRGTLNALDVLHDVTLWLVPTVLQRLGHGDVRQVRRKNMGIFSKKNAICTKQWG